MCVVHVAPLLRMSETLKLQDGTQRTVSQSDSTLNREPSLGDRINLTPGIARCLHPYVAYARRYVLCSGVLLSATYALVTPRVPLPTPIKI